MTRSTTSKVAFVLSGGASLGAIQVGMLRALYERDVVPDVIVGTSVGAMNGAFIASRPQTVETADSLAAVWRGLKRGQVFPMNPLTGLLGFLGARDHLVPASGLRRLIGRNVQHQELQELPIDLHVVAVDVLSGEELRLSRGPVTDAVLASAAIPGVIAPVHWEERTLMDGGVANNTPISHAIELGAQTIYVLPTGHACDLLRPPGGALAIALHAISLLTQRRLIKDIERHRGAARLVVLPPPCPLDIQPIDFAHADELIERALQDARDFLDGGGEDRPPIHMTMHRHSHAHEPRSQRAGHDLAGEGERGDTEAPRRIVEWRRARLLAAGLPADLAAVLAADRSVDLHGFLGLVDSGCSPELAARILAPAEGWGDAD